MGSRPANGNAQTQATLNSTLREPSKNQNTSPSNTPRIVIQPFALSKIRGLDPRSSASLFRRYLTTQIKKEVGSRRLDAELSNHAHDLPPMHRSEEHTSELQSR